MNIIVKPNNGSACYCRPDTTWERENKDFYSPECVNEIYWTPIIFARISKAGKCISPKFVSRYYDAAGYGMLMYCRQDGVSDTAQTSCADHTSILPFPLYNTVVIENSENMLEITRNGECLFKTESIGLEKIEEALCKASALTSVRIGDFIAVELDQQKPLAQKTEGPVQMKGTFCENEIFDFSIIF